MSDVRDFSRRVAARLDELVAAHTQQLIKGGAAAHDKTAGLIIGLATARAELDREMRNWFTQADTEAA